MKNIFFICVINIFFCLSCKKAITERTSNYPQLNPQNTDENAGIWKPILLASPDEFAIDAPIATNTSTYRTGINEIKSYQANYSKENQDLINYWSIGGVLRWNQIMQELVAKHNRPPYQNENGTYPIPLASNPFANPEFPFSNPPYAARAYAYLSTAQYDALIATWYYKKKFNSLPAYASDPNIKVLIPKSNLSSFPSEDGVLAGVSSEILKLLFPTEISFIQQKVEEQIKYKIIAGISIRNDIEASFLLGKKVAAKYIARAATDGAGAAVGNQTVWTSLEKSALDRGETPWKSLENPVRPPMLPMFGNVNSFLISSTEFKATRPIPPPSTNSALFLKELNEVKYFASNATKEQLKTVTFWADGVGTYTPPGHWNAIAIDLFAYKSYSEVRWARNMAMLNMAMFDAAISCWDAKYYYFNPRPCQVNPEIKTLTGVPNFPAYVSGHSTFSGAAASVLSYIIPEQSQNLTEMANEASMSRLYGGIHYRSDCEQGLKLGKDIAKFTLLRANSDGAN